MKNIGIFEFDEISENTLELQILYKHSIEAFFLSIFNFATVDKELIDNEIPKINVGNNYFLKYSTLGSDYVYLRNRINLDKLSKEDMHTLKNNLKTGELLSFEFVSRTFKDVLFKSDNVFYGTAIPENEFPGDTLVFEFAYDQRRLKDINQLITIQGFTGKLNNNLNVSLKDVLGCNIGIHTYNGLERLYEEDQEVLFK